MATGSQSFSKGSDEIPNHDCDVCLSNHKTLEAVSYCTICCEYLCQSCDLSHRGSKASRDHTILIGNNVPSGSTRTKPTLPFMFCDTHKNTLLNIYCTTHDEVICQACKMNSHRSCDTGDVSRHSALLDVEKDLKKVAKGLRDLTTRYEDLTKNRQIDKSTVNTQIQRCLRNIRQFRNIINDKLDKAEKQISSEIRCIEETMKKEIDVHVILADDILRQIGDLDKSVSECQKTVDNDVKFVGMKRAASRANEYGYILSNVQKDIYPIDIRFQPNDVLTGRIQQLHSLGTVASKNRPAINIPVEDVDLKPIVNANDFTAVIHGTYYEAWETIKRTGLNRMNRNHIHFAPGEPGQGSNISGMRSSCQVMIYLDLEKALKDGLKFFVSSNNVILSTGDENGSILPRYFAGAKDRRNGYRLDFDPNIAVKSDKRESKNGKRNNKGRKNKNDATDNVNSDSRSTDDPFSPPAKVQALDDSAVSIDKTDTSTESLPTTDKSFVSKASADDSALGQDETDTSTESYSTPDKSFVSNTVASADEPMNENICHEETKGEPQDTGILLQLETDYGDENRKDSEEPDMEMVEISDPEISKCTIDDIMKEQPPFVVVTCCGENLGEENSCINQLLVGTQTRLFIFKLEEKSLMVEGHLRKLLMDPNIKKVFFRIAEVSSSLINEYDILLNGVPIWDIEILYDKLLGQMPAREIEMIKEMGFHRKMFKKWSRKCQNSSSELEDPEEFKQQARMMYKMYLLFEKSMSDLLKRFLKRYLYEKAMPAGDDHFLVEKVKSLKLEQKEQKEKLKKKKAENNPHSAAAGGKTVGKGTAGDHSKKKGNNKKK